MDNLSPNLRAIDVEAVIRAEFVGETLLAGLDYRTIILTRMLATPDALKQARLSDRELDELLYTAEQLVIAQGLSPDPVPE